MIKIVRILTYEFPSEIDANQQMGRSLPDGMKYILSASKLRVRTVYSDLAPELEFETEITEAIAVPVGEVHE